MNQRTSKMPPAQSSNDSSSQYFWRYELPGGWSVLAGRTDEDNDVLSTELAQPRDWWFHADDVPGSHVILQARDEQEPSREILEAAAAIAAYHSKGRGAPFVSVTYTHARNVTKPRGAKTGLVQVSKSSTMKVKPAVPILNR
jgi:predicted ribosome quality control (RQC) complex YloA/Tae2 family protein